MQHQDIGYNTEDKWDECVCDCVFIISKCVVKEAYRYSIESDSRALIYCHGKLAAALIIANYE